MTTNSSIESVSNSDELLKKGAQKILTDPLNTYKLFFLFRSSVDLFDDFFRSQAKFFL